MRKSVVRVTGSLLIVTLMFACSLFEAKQPPSPKTPSPLSTVMPGTPQPTPAAIPHRHRRRRRKSHAIANPSPEAAPSPGASPAPVPGASPSPNPTPLSNTAMPSAVPTPNGPARVSIGDANADPARVKGLIEHAEANLSKADRSTLTGDDAAAFDQSSNMLAAARQAMNQGDYLAAYGLAQKANVLSDRFTSTASP